ncbi:MAG: histidinol-phosphatase [Clostridia bacterium]|nr:histidinol-phosphatase [Clostridia bacterium]
MKLANYHTHSTFCDGKNTPRETIERALALGCAEIGFSGHSYTETGDREPYCMTREGTEQYQTEIRKLKEEYRGKISVLLGVEQDYFALDGTEDYEYVIGSVHYVEKDGVYLPVDESKAILIDSVNRYYDGDYYAFIEDYYELVGKIYERTECDIVGHFDLVTKFNGDGELFDTNHPRYRAAALGALKKLMGRGLYFEINFGAVARGYRKTPYPESWILDILKENGEKILLSSDCHNNELLLFGVDRENDFVPRKR